MPKRNQKFLRSLRWSAFKIASSIGFKFLVQSGSWRDPLIESLAPRADERILDVSIDGWISGLYLARQFPGVRFISLETTEGLKSSTDGLVENLTLLRSDDYHIGCPGASIDKVVCSLALHALQPEQKGRLLREMLRVLRHGGSLHIADYDRPQGTREASMLRAASYLYGEKTAQAHLDGTWIDMISKAGFVGVRRLASYPEFFGRISLVRARRR